MKAAQPFPQGMDTHGFGLGALMLVFLVPACIWLVAEAASVAARPGDARRVEFTQAAAAIQGRLQLLRELERRAVASAAKPGYYRERRDEARRRIDELARRAAASASDAGQQARLEQLAALVQAADSRYARVLAVSGGRDAAPRLAMEKR